MPCFSLELSLHSLKRDKNDRKQFNDCKGYANKLLKEDSYNPSLCARFTIMEKYKCTHHPKFSITESLTGEDLS